MLNWSVTQGPPTFTLSVRLSCILTPLHPCVLSPWMAGLCCRMLPLIWLVLDLSDPQSHIEMQCLNYALTCCWQLGNRTSSHITFLCSFGSGSGQIWLDNVGCTGTESFLLSCGNPGIGSHDCFHSEDVAIFCTNSQITRNFSKYSCEVVHSYLYHREPFFTSCACISIERISIAQIRRLSSVTH